MNIEKIYEIIRGKLIEMLENQPDNVSLCQNELDKEIKKLQSSLTDKQLRQFELIMNIYTQLITLSDNYNFECGIKIGEKLANAFK